MKELIEKIKSFFSFNLKTLLDVNKDNLIKSSVSVPFILMILSSFITIIFFLILERYFFSDFANFYENNQIILKKNTLTENLTSQVKQFKIDVKNIDKNIRDRLHRRINMANDIASNIHKTYQHNMGLTQITDIVRESLKNVKFSTKNSQYYLYNFNGQGVLNYKNQSVINDINDVLSNRDKLGEHIIKNIGNMDEVTFEWVDLDSVTNNSIKKLTYVKKFHPLGIFIVNSIDYDDVYKEEYTQIKSKYPNLIILQNSKLSKYLNSIIANQTEPETIKIKNDFLISLNKNPSTTMTYITTTPISKHEYGWFRVIVDLIPFFSLNQEVKSVLVGMIDKDTKKTYLINEQISKIFENSQETEAYMQSQAFNKAIYLLIIFVIIAYTIYNIMSKKIPAVIKKLMQDLDAAQKEAKYRKDMLDEVLKFYPYPLLKFNEGKKTFEVNEAYKNGADFRPYYIDHDKASTTKIQLDDMPINKPKDDKK